MLHYRMPTTPLTLPRSLRRVSRTTCTRLVQPWSPLLAAGLVALAACGPGQGTDASSDIDAVPAPDAAVAEPLTAPDGQWTWVDLPGAICANGSPASVAVNLQRGSADLLMYFEGGGGCFDAYSCFEARSAARIDTDITGAEKNNIVLGLSLSPMLARGDAANPFRAASMVYVPYCTGDLHSGDATQVYTLDGVDHTVRHHGGANAQRTIDALAATLPAVTRIWNMGSSAGGYGATLNHHRLAAAWPGAELHLLADCAPMLEPITNPLADYALWQARWNMTLPPGCVGCETSFPAVIDAVAATHPASRIALLAYDEDAVIKLFFGYDLLAAPLADVIDAHYEGAGRHAFVLSSDKHTMLGEYGTVTQPGGPTLRAWIEAWATGDAAWASAP
jgi:hypothetical protein